MYNDYNCWQFLLDSVDINTRIIFFILFVITFNILQMSYCNFLHIKIALPTGESQYSKIACEKKKIYGEKPIFFKFKIAINNMQWMVKYSIKIVISAQSARLRVFVVNLTFARNGKTWIEFLIEFFLSSYDFHILACSLNKRNLKHNKISFLFRQLFQFYWYEWQRTTTSGQGSANDIQILCTVDKLCLKTSSRISIAYRCRWNVKNCCIYKNIMHSKRKSEFFFSMSLHKRSNKQMTKQKISKNQ